MIELDLLLLLLLDDRFFNASLLDEACGCVGSMMYLLSTLMTSGIEGLKAGLESQQAWISCLNISDLIDVKDGR